MSQPTKHTGQKFNRLTIVRRYIVHDVPVKHRYYCECLCDCGKTWRGQVYSVTSGTTKSCGCLLEEERKRKYTKAPIVKYKALRELMFNTDHCRDLFNFVMDCMEFTDRPIQVYDHIEYLIISDYFGNGLTIYFDGSLYFRYSDGLTRYINHFNLINLIRKLGYDNIN